MWHLERGLTSREQLVPNGRWHKVTQSNLIDKLSAWSRQSQQSAANLQMDGFDRSTCTVMMNLSDGIYASAHIW